MNVLSLFDGISCGRIALERANLPVSTYYASEIDKYAIKVSEHNYPDIIRLGDVQNWRDWDIDWSSIDLVLAGSPCQGFSFAGGQLAFDDPRSVLFFEFINVLNHIQAIREVDFLLENVKMSDWNVKVISEFTGVEPIFINSKLVSAQNRQRYYWCSWKASLPKNKGLKLQDIIEDHAIVDVDKSRPIDANYHKGGNLKRYFERGSRQLAFYNQELTDFRNLTPLECERLQTIPENYTACVSKMQRYKCVGNAWTVDVIAHLLSEMDMGDAHFQQSLFPLELSDVIK